MENKCESYNEQEFFPRLTALWNSHPDAVAFYVSTNFHDCCPRVPSFERARAKPPGRRGEQWVKYQRENREYCWSPSRKIIEASLESDTHVRGCRYDTCCCKDYLPERACDLKHGGWERELNAKIQPYGYRVLVECWSEYMGDGAGGRDMNFLGVFVEKITSSLEVSTGPLFRAGNFLDVDMPRTNEVDMDSLYCRGPECN
jgi:hypothetical protein